MRAVLSIIKWLTGLVVVALLGAMLWLWQAPPDLIRLGASYAAKTVCSNALIAARDPQSVLAADVQAPGHPLLKLMRVSLNEDEGVARAGLFGFMGRGVAVFRNGIGCAAVPDNDVETARMAHLSFPQMLPKDGHWPDGEEAETLDSTALAAVLDDPAIIGPGMRALVIVRDGSIIGERFAPGISPDQPLLGWSMTKTVNVAILGTVVGAGKLSLDTRNLFAEWKNDGRNEITVEHLAALTSGLAFNEDYGGVTDVTRMLYLEPDMAAFAADKPLLYEPGSHFSYSSGSSVMLSRVWQNVLADEREALEWPYRTLFRPLGMRTAMFEADARGTYAGSSYLYASAHDWARFGQLLLQDGMWQGKRILPEGWVDWMRSPTVASGGEYGHGLWMQGPRVTTPPDRHQDEGFALPEDAYWLIGHDGQTMTIIPSLRLVILRMGLTPTILGYKPQALVEAVVRVLQAEENG
ncbi:serine hydrolase [Chelativorans sp. Marseille-P2723]|uniref:serine hydrolase domain-containing protein n=1 Tax=Chelativorans sp. Marseille-P2723 TaxID=2709133 RepID=UPI00156E0371|nr:serine hydrolase [Chelativorans sp. Marseille-P2723]